MTDQEPEHPRFQDAYDALTEPAAFTEAGIDMQTLLRLSGRGLVATTVDRVKGAEDEEPAVIYQIVDGSIAQNFLLSLSDDDPEKVQKLRRFISDAKSMEDIDFRLRYDL